MTPETRRAEKFDAAIKHLDWCAQVPHTVDNIVGIYAEKTRTTQRPPNTAGVRYAVPDRFTRSAHARVCASSASPDNPGGS